VRYEECARRCRGGGAPAGRLQYGAASGGNQVPDHGGFVLDRGDLVEHHVLTDVGDFWA
jgi:hypothetical protein